jgi:hypothetical protein
LSDCTTESSIAFQLRRDGAFRTFKTVEADDDCGASLKRRVTDRTRFRAQSPADGRFASTTSRVVTVRID